MHEGRQEAVAAHPLTSPSLIACHDEVLPPPNVFTETGMGGR